ncbi:MAG: HAD family hydrolase [Candidatus Lokiarchaeota archaeon]|nr:HAD family hydrolase [Candidatus Lokiarchaeota archaeon]
MRQVSDAGTKLAMFDMDGTIVAFSIDSIAARSDVIQFLKGKINLPDDVLDVKFMTTELVIRSKEYLKRVNAEQPDWSGIRAEIYKIVEAYEDKAAEISEPIDGIADVLAEIERAGIVSAICTYNSTRNARMVLARTNLARYFSLVVGRDMVPDMTKPNPAHGRYILDELGVSAENACMIGDHPFDIDMAVALGMKGIAITSNRHPPADFARFQDITIVSDEDYHLLAPAINRALRVA